MAKHLPTGSALWQAMMSDEAWTVDNYLQAEIADQLAVGNWQRQGDDKKKAPKPLDRPADMRKTKTKQNAIASKAEHFKRRAMSKDKDVI